MCVAGPVLDGVGACVCVPAGVTDETGVTVTGCDDAPCDGAVCLGVVESAGA